MPLIPPPFEDSLTLRYQNVARAAVSCKSISPPSYPFTVSVSHHFSSTRGRRSSLLARLVVVLGVDLFGGISTLILLTMSFPGVRTQWDLPAMNGSTSSLPPRSTMPSRRTLLLPSQHPSSCHGRWHLLPSAERYHAFSLNGVIAISTFFFLPGC